MSGPEKGTGIPMSWLKDNIRYSSGVGPRLFLVLTVRHYPRVRSEIQIMSRRAWHEVAQRGTGGASGRSAVGDTGTAFNYTF
jgi:hypothetical protein